MRVRLIWVILPGGALNMWFINVEAALYLCKGNANLNHNPQWLHPSIPQFNCVFFFCLFSKMLAPAWLRTSRHLTYMFMWYVPGHEALPSGSRSQTSSWFHTFLFIFHHDFSCDWMGAIWNQAKYSTWDKKYLSKSKMKNLFVNQTALTSSFSSPWSCKI